eukprot:6454175-Pyramimonas_sp.AAC.1
MESTSSSHCPSEPTERAAEHQSDLKLLELLELLEALQTVRPISSMGHVPSQTIQATERQLKGGISRSSRVECLVR